MSSINEAYVNYETALLLKGKGFEQSGCLKRYNTSGDLVEGFAYGPVAPTQQMAMRWLREVHNLSIVVDCYNDSTDYEEHGPDIEYYITYHWKVVPFIGMSHSTGDEFASYEEAAEAAIKYTLENLI